MVHNVVPFLGGKNKNAEIYGPTHLIVVQICANYTVHERLKENCL